ncbi:MAG: hypothetical protein CTY34_04555 [Methylobacter sp.]|nr:MAG: hypothetical protein CTY34_04555 [Methylobacter sp.]PPD23550.1 MAG: hypothetical protein CTY24_03895 [Methylobacter sp.]PPD37366.1 MAG: hypothetical protein CTY18_00100 [Methylomonas sp.]
MSLSMYQASIPALLRNLDNLDKIIDKAITYAEVKKIDPEVLLNARLAPDMYPLVRQVQIVTDLAKGFAARISGQDVPGYPDTEASFPELKARLAKTMEFVKSISADQVDGSETKPITLKFGTMEVKYLGQAYLLDFVLPNLYFHATMAYAILRHNGMELGKRDFLGDA